MPRDPWKISLESFLSGDELDRLLDFLECRVAECSGAPQTTAATDELIIHGLVFSGLRNSEFCTLKLQDTIVGTRRSEFRVVGTPREDRTVCVPRALSERILRYVRDIRRELLHAETDPRDLAQPLIVNERGRGYERTSLYRRVVRILTAAGLGERASVQLLRHTYGYQAYVRTGGNLLFVQRQMGHAHPMVTSIYAEFAREDYAALADMLVPQHTPASGGRQSPGTSPKNSRTRTTPRRRRNSPAS
jgi:integrase/recombinase XerD